MTSQEIEQKLLELNSELQYLADEEAELVRQYEEIEWELSDVQDALRETAYEIEQLEEEYEFAKILESGRTPDSTDPAQQTLF